MTDLFEATWITRGNWRVNLERGLAAHHPTGCMFRVVRSGSLGSAFWVDASGAPPPLEEIEVMQTRAWAVFYLTEKLRTHIRNRNSRR